MRPSAWRTRNSIRSHRRHRDPSHRRLAPGRPPPTTLRSGVVNFSVGFMQGMRQWVGFDLYTVAWIVLHAPGYWDIQKAPVTLIQSIDYDVTYWAYLSDSAKLEWVSQVGQGVLAQTDKLGKTIVQADARIDAAITAFFTHLSNLMDTGNWDGVLHTTGQIAGNLALKPPRTAWSFPERPISSSWATP